MAFSPDERDDPDAVASYLSAIRRSWLFSWIRGLSRSIGQRSANARIADCRAVILLQPKCERSQSRFCADRAREVQFSFALAICLSLNRLRTAFRRALAPSDCVSPRNGAEKLARAAFEHFEHSVTWGDTSGWRVDSEAPSRRSRRCRRRQSSSISSLARRRERRRLSSDLASRSA